MYRSLLSISFGCGLLAAACAWLLWPTEPAPRTASELMDVVMWNTEPIGGAFSLIDQDGRRRTDQDFRGKILLVYFGFTLCTDACPIDMQSMTTALDTLGKGEAEVQPLFITVDPERDRPEQLKSYIKWFHPRMIGLTGDPAEVRKVARAYKVYYGRSAVAPTSGEIDHAGFVFVVGKDGRYLGFMPPGTSADRMAEVIRAGLEDHRPQPGSAR